MRLGQNLLVLIKKKRVLDLEVSPECPVFGSYHQPFFPPRSLIQSS